MQVDPNYNNLHNEYNNNSQKLFFSNFNEAFKHDLKKFKFLCEKFSKKRNNKISNLNIFDTQDFDIVVNIVEQYKKTKYYNLLYKIVENIFKNVEYVEKNTIGSYFAGCIVSSNFDNSCSVTCSGSIQTPTDIENGTTCEKTVVFAEKSDNGYKFINIDKNDENEIYIFIDSMSLNSFDGFSLNEKKN